MHTDRNLNSTSKQQEKKTSSSLQYEVCKRNLEFGHPLYFISE